MRQDINSNLIIRIKLNLIETFLGFDKVFKIERRLVHIKRPRGTTLNKENLRIEGWGMPCHDGVRDTGDLIIYFLTERPPLGITKINIVMKGNSQ